jgi:hypothetical protein
MSIFNISFSTLIQHFIETFHFGEVFLTNQRNAAGQGARGGATGTVPFSTVTRVRTSTRVLVLPFLLKSLISKKTAMLLVLSTGLLRAIPMLSSEGHNSALFAFPNPKSLALHNLLTFLK